MTPEQLAKQSAALRGKPLSERNKAGLRKAWEKRRLVGVSDETKRKMSATLRGRKFSVTHRAAISASKMGDANPAKRPDVRAKISMAVRAFHSRKAES
jgi:hypothetical protein